MKSENLDLGVTQVGMVERVARALCAAHEGRETGEPDGTNLYAPHQVKDDTTLRNWMAYEDMARAAIEATREPTPAMLNACDGLALSGQYADAESARLVWSTMAAAALKE